MKVEGAIVLLKGNAGVSSAPICHLLAENNYDYTTAQSNWEQAPNNIQRERKCLKK